MRRLPWLVAVALLVEVIVVQPVQAGESPPAEAARLPSVTLDAPTDENLVYPPAPQEQRSPRLVRQTRNNCAFASVAMLVDKWTDGELQPDQASLRQASGVPDGPVGFRALGRAVAAVTGIDLRWSPNGGDRLTWDDVLLRLANGGGAVLIGSYSELPAHYQRWDRNYAALGRALSGHAMYVERYEPDDGGRVWLMDPLGRGRGFEGEWIAAEDLRRFVWHYARGYVAAAATPAREVVTEVQPESPLGYRLRTPRIAGTERVLAGQELSVRLPLRRSKGTKRPKDLSLFVSWTPLEIDPQPDGEAEETGYSELLADDEALRDADQSAIAVEWPADDEALWLEKWLARSLALTAAEDEAEADATVGLEEEQAEAVLYEEASEAVLDPIELLVPLKAVGRRLSAVVTAPEVPGTYSLSLQVRNAEGFSIPSGKQYEPHTFDMRVFGSLAAGYGELQLDEPLLFGSLSTVTLPVENLGRLDWQAEDPVRLVGLWQGKRRTWLAGSAMVELAAGESTAVSFQANVPSKSRKASLVLELVTADGVPFSAYGFEAVTTDLSFEAAPFVSDEIKRGPLGR